MGKANQSFNNNIITGGLNPRGAYDNAATYQKGDEVYYASTGNAYTCLVDGTTGVLPTDTSKWMISGKKGDTGLTGPKGDPGTDANEIIFSDVDPTGGDGVDNDVWIMTDNGTSYNQWDVLRKITGTWTLEGNIKGATGASGADAASVTSGSADPTGGNDGDFYFQTGTGSTGVAGDFWKKITGTWAIQMNIIGPPGSSGGGDNASAQWFDTGIDHTITGGGGTINFGGSKDMKVVIPADGDYLISAEVTEDWSAVTAASGEGTYYQFVKTVGSGAPLALGPNLVGTCVSTLSSAIVGPNKFSRSWQVVVPGLVAGDEVSLTVVKIGSSTGAIKVVSAFGDAHSFMNAVKCS